MKRFRNFVSSLLLVFSVAALTWAADLPTAAPEDVGFSSERLARIGPVIKGEIEKGSVSGRGDSGRAQGQGRLLRQLRATRPVRAASR